MAKKLFSKDNKDVFGSQLSRIVKGIDESNRTIEIIASTSDIDRDGDIISQSGWVLDNYKKNPVVLFSHRYDNPAIAACKRIKRTKDQLILTHKFPPIGVYSFADTIFELYKAKIMNAGSVGFFPLESEPRKSKGEVCGNIFTKQELLEHSLCSVPSNPAAVTMAIKSLPVHIRTSGKIKNLLGVILNGNELPFDPFADFFSEQDRANAEEAVEELLDGDIEVVDEDKKFYAIPKTFNTYGDKQMNWQERKEHLEAMLTTVEKDSELAKYFEDELAIVEKQMNDETVKSFPLPAAVGSKTLHNKPKHKRLTVVDDHDRVHQAISIKENLSDLNGRDKSRFRPGYAGRILRACLVGNTNDLDDEERKEFNKAMAENTGASGGFTLPNASSERIWDLARNASQVQNAGAWTLPLTTPTLQLLKVTQDPTAYFRQELDSLTESEGAFAPVILKPMVLGVLVRISEELLMDSNQAAEVIQSSMAKAIGLKMDYSALYGTGTSVDGPKGICSCDNINTYSLGTNGASISSYDPWSYAVQYILQNNFTPNATLFSARTAGILDRLKETGTAAPLSPPPSFQRLTKYVTNQLPDTETQGTSTTSSSSIVGQFDQLVFGIRSNISVQMTNSGTGSTGTDSFSTLTVLIRAWMRYDIAILNEKAFTRILGITG